MTGLFKSINKYNLLNVNTENDGLKTQHNETINIVTNKTNELFSFYDILIEMKKMIY